MIYNTNPFSAPLHSSISAFSFLFFRFISSLFVFTRTYRLDALGLVEPLSASPSCFRHGRLFITAPLRHDERRYEGRYRDTCTALSLFHRVRHCAVSRLPDYRDKQPEKPRWMTRHAITVAPRDFRASIPRVFSEMALIGVSRTRAQWAKWTRYNRGRLWDEIFLRMRCGFHFPLGVY